MDIPVSGGLAEELMRRAIRCAKDGIAAGQSPFAALIYELSAGRVLALEHNEVWARMDPTAHAEVTAIRRAAAAGRRIDFSGCWLWSTCEPCPMCMAAIHWAKLEGAIFGASIDDAAGAGFHELRLPAQTLLEAGGSPVRLAGPVLADECRQLFAEWKAAGKSATY